MERKFLIFALSEELFAIELKHSREIIPYSAPTPLPSMPAFFEGLIHLRGFFLPLINIKRLLGMEEKATAAGKKLKVKIIVVSVFKKIVGLRADDVEDITAIEEGRILPAPSLVSSMDANFFSGGFYLKDRVILIIDIAKLFNEFVLPHKISRKERRA